VRESRFVVLRHNVGPGTSRAGELHFDWMFEIDGMLRTWATAPIERFDQSIELDCHRLADHRIDYLDYEGEISGDRGSVSRVLSGSFRLIEDLPDRFEAQLFRTGEMHPIESFVCQRMSDDRGASEGEPRADWVLSLSTGR